jgi:outer membrane protein insertion porin family/translocation and assembly module TamA
MPMVDVTARTGLMAALAAGALGCAAVPPGRSAVDVVDLIGAKAVSASDVTDKLATTASPKFLGLLPGVVYDYSVLDPSALQRDLARVERYYRGRGFFEAHARTARVVAAGPNHVRVEIVVEEGPPSLNRRIEIDGLEGLPSAIAGEVRQALTDAIPPGTRFDEEAYRNVQTALTRALTDRGYAYAKVDVSAQADLPAHAVDYAFKVEPGPAATFGTVSIASVEADGSPGRLGEIEEAPIRRALHIHEGGTYSTAKIDSATQALLDLKVFSAVEVVPELPDPPRDVVPLAVKVSPTKLRSLRLGGGVELDEIKTEVHALVGWEDLNFFGGLRDMSVDFEPGVVLYPFRANNIVGPEKLQLLPEEHLRAQFRQNGFLEARTSLFVRPEMNTYPLLVETNPTQGSNVVGYFEPKGAVGLDRRFGKHFFASLGHNVQTEVPIPYQGPLDKTLPGVLLSYPQLITTFDFRDDQVHPHLGLYLSNDLQVAGLGGNARDLRIQPEVRGYIPIAKGVTLAARGSVGFLFSFNYGDYVQNHLADDKTPDTVQTNTDIEIAYFRGFFSGGPGSNRGFPVRGIAPHGFVPFLNPATASTQVSIDCDPAVTKKAADPSCAIPIGGFSLWESSVEVRFDVSGPFGVATFCDAGDVSAHEVDIRLSHLHLSCGAGVRYATPVGPLRLDIGYRVQPLQVLGFSSETAVSNADRTEGVQPLIFYQPLAVAFGLGEAF